MRTAIEVNKPALVAAVNEAEKNGPLPNHDALWKAAAEIYNKTKPKLDKEISFSVVKSRVSDWKIPIKTVAGKRGRSSMTDEQKQKMREARQAGGGRKPRAEKLKVFEKEFAELRRVTPETNHGDIDKMQAGSLKAAVRRMCMDCSDNKSAEVKMCTVGGKCPLYAFRPNAIPLAEALKLAKKRDKQEEKEEQREAA